MIINFHINQNKLRRINSKEYKIAKLFLVINSIHTFKNKKILKFFKDYKHLFKITGIDAYNFCLIAEGKVDILIESGLKNMT